MSQTTQSDLLIIGSGGAGLSAALQATQLGLSVTVVTQSLPTAAQTAMAQGGINAVLDTRSDSVASHIEDTLRAAHGLADPDRVERMCREAPEAIAWLHRMGVPFNTAEIVEGDEVPPLAQRRLGGATHPRACYAQDYTGLKILHTLYDRCLAAGVTFVTEHTLLNLITHADGEEREPTVLGGTFWDSRAGEVSAYTAHHTLVATGGYGELYHGYTTNTYGATGDGIAAVLRAGGVVSDMEFIQFHPTAMADSMVLISESARGAGAHLITEEGERFTDELAARDVVARAIFDRIRSGEHVYLDLRPIDPQILQRLMPQELHLARIHAGVDPLHEPIPILPAVHYTMGGIEVDDDHGITGLRNASAVGECTNSHLHGANRLGGNSLLEIVALGRRSAQRIAGKLTQSSIDPDPELVAAQIASDEEQIAALFARPQTHNLYYKRKILGKRLYHSAGIVRDNELLADARGYLEELHTKLPTIGLPDPSRTHNPYLTDYLAFTNTLLLADALIQSASLRTESRGAHYRSDYPQEDPSWSRHITCRWEKGEIRCN